MKMGGRLSHNVYKNNIQRKMQMGCEEGHEMGNQDCSAHAHTKMQIERMKSQKMEEMLITR